jgi:hypothetical protein
VARTAILDYNAWMKYICILALLAVTMSSGCLRSNGVLADYTFRTRYTEYKVGEIPQDWHRVSLRGADLAYLHDKDGSTLLINSKCDHAEDAPLVALTFHLLIGMTETNVIEQKTRANSEREGLETTVEAKLDGVKRKMRIFVLKKDTCIFDVVMSAPPSKFDEGLVVYDSAMRGFHVPGMPK